MKAQWRDIDMAQWDAGHAQACAPLQQDWAYGASMAALGVPVLRASVEADGQPVALAQFMLRRWGSVASVALCSRGPVWLQDISAADKARVYAELKRSMPKAGWGLHLHMVSPEETDAAQQGLRSLRRVMSGYATVMLDLRQDLSDLRASLTSKWRGRLASAENSELSVHRVGTNAGQYRWLLDQQQSMGAQRGFASLPLPFYDLYVPSRQQPSQTVLTLRADLGRDRVAAMMFLLHGRAATYQVGWANDLGRQTHAHNLLLWRGVEELQKRGIQRLDLGGINTERSAGIARFKMSTGGAVHILTGTYF